MRDAKHISEMTLGELEAGLRQAREALRIAKANYEFTEQEIQRDRMKEFEAAMTNRMLPGAAAAAI